MYVVSHDFADVLDEGSVRCASPIVLTTLLLSHAVSRVDDISEGNPRGVASDDERTVDSRSEAALATHGGASRFN